jgi:phosphoribosylaminoimidazole-succinocarboxamide synthase
MDEEWISTISKRYIELYEKVIGQPFKPEALSDEETYGRTIDSLNKLALI